MGIPTLVLILQGGYEIQVYNIWHLWRAVQMGGIMHPGDWEGLWGWLPSKWLKAGRQRLGYWSQSVIFLPWTTGNPDIIPMGLARDLMVSSVLVCSGCQSKMPHTGRLKEQTFIFSQSWRLKLVLKVLGDGFLGGLSGLQTLPPRGPSHGLSSVPTQRHTLWCLFLFLEGHQFYPMKTHPYGLTWPLLLSL